jgi:uncharacterized RDD family membrane protein YckC
MVMTRLLDHIILGVILAVLGLLLMVAFASGGVPGVWAAVIGVVLMLGVHWFYFGILELSLDGQTPGKRAARLRVVDETGGSASRSALLLRNLLRPVDYLVGVLLIAADPRARRLGDRMAGTLVVHEARQASELVVGRLPAGWGPRHVAVVEAFCERCSTLRPEEAGHLARRILAMLRRDDPALAAEVEVGSDPVEAVRSLLKVSRL